MTFLSVYLLIGLDGSGYSSYIDNMILRERDANTSWTAASDGTLEERRYYCQNWRADVSAIITSGGVMVEWAKYSPYGIPFGLPGADTDSDGDCDATDISNMNNPPGSYDVRYDIDLDGDNDATDRAIAQTYYQGTTYGWDTLSSNPDTGTGNRKGYAGYEYDSNISMYHIRNRVFHPELGRWTRRDPLGYVDGANTFEYVASLPLLALDPGGTEIWINNKFNAFIGSTHVNRPGGFLGSWYFPAVLPSYYEVIVGTDNRMAGMTGTSRINTVFQLETDWIGSRSAIYNMQAWSDPTIIMRRLVTGIFLAPWKTHVRTAIPTVKWSRDRAECYSEVNIIANGRFPFIPVGPSIDFDVTWAFQMVGKLVGTKCMCEVIAQVRGVHDSYPDYEAIVDNYSMLLHNYVSPDLKPSYSNLTTPAPYFVSPLYRKIVNFPPPGSPADGCCTCYR